MFGLKKKGPSQPTGPFVHTEGCKLAVADPDYQPPWQEVEEGHWRRICQCYSDDRYEPRADSRTRLDPMDLSTLRHFGECKHRDVTDPDILEAVLSVLVRENYWYVQCRTCTSGWQTSFYATESAG